MKPQISESELVNQCIKYLFSIGCYVWRQNTGVWRVGKRVIRYGLNGSGDIIGLTPQGTFISVECKVGYNKLSEAQELFRDRIEEKNGIYITAYCVEDIAEALDR